MKTKTDYTPYHPRWYRRQISVWWWLQDRAYLLFVVRELTSVFVAFFAVMLLWQVSALRAGPEAHADFLARLRTPSFVVLHGVALVFVLFHTITWFLLTPQAMILRVRGRRLPDGPIVAASLVAWLLLSAAVAWALMRT